MHSFFARLQARRVAALVVTAGMSACATYHAKPLPEHAASAPSLSQLRGYDASALPLDTAAVEQLVLLNNPELKTQRARHQAAQAQRLQDGVLPNPIIGGSIGYLLSGPGDATAWTASISQDIAALITLRPRREAAQANADEVDAGLLWEQWQTLGKARLLVIDLVQGERQLALQDQAMQMQAQREARIVRAVNAGNLAHVAVAADLAAAADARTARNELQRRLLDQRQQLNALLSLQPGVELPLVSALPPASLDAAQTRSQFDSVSRRRPDLVALQLGYRAQEANLRAAVLAQFPPLSIGYDASQDNSRVRNGGPAVSLGLPIFDHHQHDVAMASATREQLQQEYTTRLATAHDEVDAMLAQYAQLDAQKRDLIAAASDAARAAVDAKQAEQVGLLDLRDATDLQMAALGRQLAVLLMDQNMLEQQAAIDLLVGRGMPISLPQNVIAP